MFSCARQDSKTGILTDAKMYLSGWDILAIWDIKESKSHFSIFQDIL